MGASALSQCTHGMTKAAGTMLQAAPAIGRSQSGDAFEGQALVLKVVIAPIEASLGACTSGFSVGDEVFVARLETAPGLEPLSFRFREHERQSWPSSHRFQSSRRSWHVNAVGSAGHRPCVLQMSIMPALRSLENATLDIDDAKDAISYASRFNLYQQQQQQKAEWGELPPCIKVAAPVACTVLHSAFPSMVPVGTACTLIPYPLMEVNKYVFDGTEDFLEWPQAFFHYAAYVSNGKQMVCDIQGGELDSGDILLVDPCILRTEMLNVSDLVHVVATSAGAQAVSAVTSDRGGTSATTAFAGPTTDRFDRLHPRCAQVCRGFDPQRRSVKKNTGACGMIGGACGLGR